MDRGGAFETRAFLFMVTLWFVNGCNYTPDADYSDLDLATVTGKVTLDGKNLAGARVIFEATDTTYSYGVTDDSGSYSLMFDSRMAGVLPGAKIVRITMGGALGETEAEDGLEEDAEPSAADITIPEKYNSKSELTRVVQSGSQTFDFELKSAR
jgi:hypothetical protein